MKIDLRNARSELLESDDEEYTSMPTRGETASNGKQGFSSDDEDYMPCFLDVSDGSQLGKSLDTTDDAIDEDEVADNNKSNKANAGKSSKSKVYSVDQIEADFKEAEKCKALFHEERKGLQLIYEQANEDDLLPEHKIHLEKINIVENRINKVHPGEAIFDHSRFQSLFSYPGSLTLTSCKFQPGNSSTDCALASLHSDELLEFLTPDFIRMVFSTISCPESFQTFVFYLLSISPDSCASRRLHGILDAILHRRLSTWTPSTLDICHVLVNYGSSISLLCPDMDLLDFNETDLCFVTQQPAKIKNEGHGIVQGFKQLNMKLVVQYFIDCLAVRPENYTSKDCLCLTLILLRVSLDPSLTGGQLRLDVEMFLAAVILAVRTEEWENWVKLLCDRVHKVTTNYHNMVCLVGLLPLVERGMHLKRVLSLVFIHQFLPNANQFADLMNPKIQLSLNFLNSLQISTNGTDFYMSWSIVQLIESSIGSEPLAEEMDEVLGVIRSLQEKVKQLKDEVKKVDQTMLKDQMVWLVSKLNVLGKRRHRNDKIFESILAPVTVHQIANLSEDDSSSEENMDIEQDC